MCGSVGRSPFRRLSIDAVRRLLVKIRVLLGVLGPPIIEEGTWTVSDTVRGSVYAGTVRNEWSSTAEVNADG